MVDATATHVIDIEILCADAKGFDSLIASLTDAPPPGVSLKVEDLSTTGAFDVEWVVGVLASIPIGIGTSTFASWLYDRVKQDPPAANVIVVGGERIDVRLGDARGQISILVDNAAAGGKQAEGRGGDAV